MNWEFFVATYHYLLEDTTFKIAMKAFSAWLNKDASTVSKLLNTDYDKVIIDMELYDEL